MWNRCIFRTSQGIAFSLGKRLADDEGTISLRRNTEVHVQKSLESGNAVKWSKRDGKARLTVAGGIG